MKFFYPEIKFTIFPIELKIVFAFKFVLAAIELVILHIASMFINV